MPGVTIRRLFWPAVALTVAIPVLNGVWVQFNLGGTDVTSIVDNGFSILAPLLAAAGCAWAGARLRGHARVGWILLGASSLSWGIGSIIWADLQVVQRQTVPFPSWADAGFLGQIPLAVAGLARLGSERLRATSRLRNSLDGLIIAGSLLFVSWVTALGTAYTTATGSVFTKAVGLAYPLADVMMCSVVIFLVSRARGGARLPLLLVGLGLVANTFSDSAFTYLQLDHSYGSNNVIDAGWVAGFMLIALGAFRQLSSDAVVSRGGQVTRTAVLLPYIGVGMAGILAVLQEVRHGSLEPFLFWNGLVIIALVVGRQLVTLLENLEGRTEDLRRSEQRFRSLVQNSSDAITIIDQDGRVQYQSPSLERIFGYSPDALAGHPLTEIIHPDDIAPITAMLQTLRDRPGGSAVIEGRLRHRDGRWRTGELTVTSLLGEPAVGGLVINTRDITDRKLLEEQLAHQAFHDSLTGIANRALFKDRLQQTLARATRRKERPAVLFFDLDGFKSINDSLGHEVGDQLLAAVADRLQECVRKGDTMARLGGDEFAILLEDTNEPEAAVQVAQRIIEALRRPFVLNEREVFIRASLGIAPMITGKEDGNELLRNADIAMYMAKGAGRGRYEIFNPDMHAAMMTRLALEADLQRAVERGEFFVVYQPLVRLSSARPAGVEALLRWQHPARGLLSPLTFIPIAEKTGTIVPIGRWVLREACRQVQEWQRIAPALELSVNVSTRQLRDPGLVDDVRQALADTGLPPTLLTLEMTESILIDDVEKTLITLKALKALGLRLAIDDFGTGYSSLGYLHEFPVDSLKIDRSFISALSSTEREPIVETIMSMGRALHLEVVAEGIEERSQVLELQRLQCQLGQGFLFSKPMPAEDVPGYLKRAMEQAA